MSPAGQRTWIVFDRKAFAHDLDNLHPETRWCPPGLVSNLISSLFRIEGPVYTVTSACAASAQAIGAGLHMIRRGEVDAVLAGGADSMINPMGLIGFLLLGAATTENDPPWRASKPFDRKRKGIVIGEGAGMVVLEELSHALETECAHICGIGGIWVFNGRIPANGASRQRKGRGASHENGVGGCRC